MKDPKSIFKEAWTLIPWYLQNVKIIKATLGELFRRILMKNKLVIAIGS